MTGPAVATVHEHTLAVCGHKHRSSHHLGIVHCGACKKAREVVEITTYDVDAAGNVVRGARS